MKRPHLLDMEICCKELEGVLKTPDAYDMDGRKVLLKLGKKYHQINYCPFCGGGKQQNE